MSELRVIAGARQCTWCILAAKHNLQLTTNKPWLNLCSKLQFNFPNGLVQHFRLHFLLVASYNRFNTRAKWFRMHLITTQLLHVKNRNSIFTFPGDRLEYFTKRHALLCDKSNWMHFIKLKLWNPFLRWNAVRGQQELKTEKWRWLALRPKWNALYHSSSWHKVFNFVADTRWSVATLYNHYRFFRTIWEANCYGFQ